MLPARVIKAVRFIFVVIMVIALEHLLWDLNMELTSSVESIYHTYLTRKVTFTVGHYISDRRKDFTYDQNVIPIISTFCHAVLYWRDYKDTTWFKCQRYLSFMYMIAIAWCNMLLFYNMEFNHICWNHPIYWLKYIHHNIHS